MSELRWIIAAIAALVIIGFYVSARIRRARDDGRFWADHQLPDAEVLDGVTRAGDDGALSEDELPHLSASREDAADVSDEMLQETTQSPDSAPIEELTLIHYLVHPSGEFKGADVYQAAQTAGLGFFGKDALECIDPQSGTAVFSLASAVGDGRIPKGELDSFSSAALVLFLQLPSPWPGLKAYHKLLNAANIFVETFNAKVLDDNRSTLTEQGMRLCQERIAEFDARHQARLRAKPAGGEPTA